MKALVTGGTGHLGANLVRALLGSGVEVRALVRVDERGALAGLELERVSGDVRDLEAMRRVVRGCELVYHCAAKLSTVAGGEREIYDCNVLGTRNLLAAARDASVRRVVVTGSFSAVGHRPDAASDESVPFYPFEEHLPYEITKHLVEHECWRAALDGLDVVVATSCAIIGPHDYKPSRMGRTLIDFARGKLRAYIPGGFEFVAARDIVAGHLLAMEKGRKGQRYIFGSGYVSVDELMGLFEEATGQPRPRLRLPPPLMMAIAQVASPILSRFLPRVEQRLTPAAVRLLTQGRHADCSRARDELGYHPTPIADAVREACQDFVRRGLIPNGRTMVAVAPPPVPPPPAASHTLPTQPHAGAQP